MLKKFENFENKNGVLYRLSGWHSLNKTWLDEHKDSINLNYISNGSSSLFVAITNMLYDNAKLLIQYGADPNLGDKEVGNSDSSSPLTEVIRNVVTSSSMNWVESLRDTIKFLKFLLPYVDVNLRSKLDGDTALNILSQSTKKNYTRTLNTGVISHNMTIDDDLFVEIFKLLLKYDIDLSITDNQNNDFLEYIGEELKNSLYDKFDEVSIYISIKKYNL